jgi:histidinol-phosphate aminotransferase
LTSTAYEVSYKGLKINLEFRIGLFVEFGIVDEISRWRHKMNKTGNHNAFSRRAFLGTITGTTAMALIGFDRRAIAGRLPQSELIADYVGRLCYNENPLGPSPLASQAIKNNADMAHRYPDWFAESLRAELASRYDLSANKIICGAGATEIIRLCATAFSQPGGNVVAPYPSYGQFPADAEFLGSSARYADLDANYSVDLQNLMSLVDDDTTAVCITNPNNPTATVIDPQGLKDFVDNLPSQVVTIVDEAYHDYIFGGINPSTYPSAIDLVHTGRNVVVVKTFSKAHGLAGARIGYAVGPTAAISSMRPYQLYATISRPSLAAAKESLYDQQHIRNTINLANEVKAYCFHQFDQMGLEYIPSETNFFMVDVGRQADPVRSQLAQRGIYVRTGWGMPNHLRVSAGIMPEMIDFTEALSDILGGIPNSGGKGDISDGPKMIELYQAYPNPFNSSARIKIVLPRAGHTKLEIFDIRGRIVKTLKNGMLRSGEHSFFWNGTNQSGRSVSSSSYFYRLTSDGNVITRRMLYLK